MEGQGGEACRIQRGPVWPMEVGVNKKMVPPSERVEQDVHSVCQGVRRIPGSCTIDSWCWGNGGTCPVLGGQ